MKIINTKSTKRSESSIQTTPIEGLPKTTEIHEKALFLIDQFIESENSYSAKKIDANTLLKKLYSATNNTFKGDYWRTHLPKEDMTHENTSPFKEMLLKIPPSIRPEPIDFEESRFVDHINYDFNVLRLYSDARDDELQEEIDILNSRLGLVGCNFDQDMILTTTELTNNGEISITHDSINHSTNVDNSYCQMSIADGNKISNEWVVPATGNLVVCGWLDSTSALNSKAIPSAYCVLEGKINGQWEIISAQSVIPAKNITYVGFNVPVNKGLVIRARTGFVVGVKSGQYPNEQDGYDSLSNSTPNGFKCQVFSHKDYVDTTTTSIV